METFLVLLAAAVVVWIIVSRRKRGRAARVSAAATGTYGSILSDGPDGICEAMRLSYQKHLALATSGAIGAPGDSPHASAMFGSLGSRNKVSRLPTNEMYLWIELAPFMALPEAAGLRALCLYAAWREIPDRMSSGDLLTLRSSVADGVRVMLRTVSPFLKVAGRPDFAIAWRNLLDPDLTSQLTRHAL